MVDLVFARQWDPLRQHIVGPPWSVRAIIQSCIGVGIRGYAVPDKSVGPPDQAPSNPRPTRVLKYGLAAVTPFVTRV